MSTPVSAPPAPTPAPALIAGSGGSGEGRGGGSWWFRPVPRNRIAAMRILAYLFVVADVVKLTPWVAPHGRLDGVLYAPLKLGRLLPFPVPTETLVAATRIGLVVAALVACSGRLPRLLGTVVAVLYLEWMLIAMSYGKVDHDRLGFVVLLFVLPTIGRARLGDSTPDPAAGWALRLVQIGAVATYFLAAVAKVRFGGWGWVNSATLLRAVLRRGTGLGDWTGEHPELLHAFQYVLFTAEFASPVLLVDGRWRRFGVYLAYLFHAMTYAALTIAFYPHLVAMASFLATDRLAGALDRLRRWRPTRRRRPVVAGP